MSHRDIAIQAELTDTRAWLDQFAAAPAPVTTGLNLQVRREGALTMVRSLIPFSHFNIVLTLGCPAPVDEAAFAAIERFYAGQRHWVLVNDFSEPATLAQQLLARGYEPAGEWDRVVMSAAQPARWAPHAQGCEIVGAENADEWIAFIRQCYGMPPPIGEWLRALVDRRSWIHVLRREDGRPGAKVVMVRSIFVADDGWSWLGIDAPVPGVMAPCFDDDLRVTATLLDAAVPRPSSATSRRPRRRGRAGPTTTGGHSASSAPTGATCTREPEAACAPPGLGICAAETPAPSPRLRGEGWGEGWPEVHGEWRSR